MRSFEEPLGFFNPKFLEISRGCLSHRIAKSPVEVPHAHIQTSRHHFGCQLTAEVLTNKRLNPQDLLVVVPVSSREHRIGQLGVAAHLDQKSLGHQYGCFMAVV